MKLLAATIVLSLSASALACTHEHAPDYGVSIARVGDDGSEHVLQGPYVLGGRLELEILDPDPNHVGYTRPTSIVSFRVDPPDALAIARKYDDRLVVTFAREVDARLEVTTASGLTGSVALPVHAAARVEAHPYLAAGQALAKVPDALATRTFRLAPGTAIGFDALAYDASGTKLEGFDFVDWRAEPAGSIAFEPFASNDNLVRAVPADGARGAARLVATARANAIASGVAIALDDGPAAPASVAAFHAYCTLFSCTDPQAIDVTSGRGRVDDVTVGALLALDLYALDAAGDVLLAQDKVAPTVDPPGAPLDASLFLAPNTVFVTARQPGDAAVTLSYMGVPTTIDLHAVTR